MYGGRWNSPGTRMVYTAGSISLVVLEILVHLDQTSLLSSYSLCEVSFDNSLVETLDRSLLPHDWQASPPPSELRRIGDGWIESRRTAVLEVPSSVVARESNYLINPAHPDFDSLHIGSPEPFVLDERLLGS